MVVFNHTFTSDKPVYFPQNWESGKTYIEQYAEWQSTTQYWIYSNLLQIAASSLFIGLLFVLFLALKQVRRIQKMEKDSIERKRQGKYIKASFLVPIGLLAILCSYYLIVFLLEEWTRIVLFKGLVFCILAYSSYYFYKILKPYIQKWKRDRARQKKIEQNANNKNKQ